MASEKKKFYYNRELSWMDFNARVLEEAQKKDNPVMERLRFLAITGSNLDEFFMVRVAGVKGQVRSGYTKPDDSGLTPKELLAALEKKDARVHGKAVFLPVPLHSAGAQKAGGHRISAAG